jgi:phosphatidylinositol alpha-1,6-mannosyltransferase
MRLLALFSGLAKPGGIARHNRVLHQAMAEYARERSAEFEVLSLHDDQQQRNGSSRASVIGTRGRRGLFLVSVARRLMSHYDFVLAGQADFAPFLIPFSASRHRPFRAVFIYGVEVWRSLPAHKRLGLHNADAIFSISEHTARLASRAQGVPLRSIEIVRPPLDPEFALEAARVRKDWSKAERRLLTVSRLERLDVDKGVDKVIRSIVDVRGAIPDVSYTVVGDGSDRPRLERLARSLSVNEHVRFVGRVPEDELHRHYRSADLFVLPSTKEGFGLAFLEAMAYGLPVVGARAGGIPEVVTDGETGVLVDPASGATLGHAITSLLQDRDRSRLLGLEGMRRVGRDFSYQAFRQFLFGRLDKALLARGAIE